MAAQAVKSTGDYRDSGAIGHLMDVVLTMRRPDAEGPTRILERKKARWFLPEKVAVELVENRYERTTAKATNDARRETVHEALTPEWQTAAQVAVVLNRKEQAVRRDLNALHEAGLIDREDSRGNQPHRYRARLSVAGTFKETCTDDQQTAGATCRSLVSDQHLTGDQQGENDDLPF
jgi:hypothetical protein